MEININDLSNADFKTLSNAVNDINKKWAVEGTYLNSIKGDPSFDSDEYANHLQDLEAAYAQLSSIWNSFTPSLSLGGVQRDNSHPNSKLHEVDKAGLLFKEISNFNANYERLIDYRNEKSHLGRIEQQLFDRITQLESSIYQNTKERVDTLTNVVRDDLNKGIQDLIGLKSELGLAREFGEKIQTELASAKKKEFRFMLAFIVALVLIPVSVFIEHYFITSIDDISSLILKGSVAVSLLFVSLFFFSQYRTYMMLRLRYTHLDGFLGGGATFISQLLESENPEFKLEINKKLAELFMSLDDVLKMVQKNKHPTELTLDKAELVYDKIMKLKR